MIGHTPIEDTTVVLVLTGSQPTVLDWADLYVSEPDLSRCPLIVTYDERGQDAIQDVVERLKDVTTVRLPEDTSPDRLELVKAYASVFDGITTPYFCLTTIPRRLDGYATTLRHQVANARARVREIGLEIDRAILLYTRHDRALAPRAYLWHMLSTKDADLGAPLRDYLGYLALMYGVLSLEGIDPRYDTGEIELIARVAYGRFNTEQPPPWSYRLAVVSGRADVYAEGPATVSRRVDNQGNRRWENLRASVPVADVPDGNHRVTIGLETEFECLRVLRPLHPRPGVLACARTFLLPGRPGGNAGVTRYLVHTIRNAPHTWITVQHEIGRGARGRWYRTLLKKDLRFILTGRSARKIRLARLLRLLTGPYYRRRSIWLIGERADTAQDNGFHLFRHLREQQPRRKVYYVIDKDCPQYPRVGRLGQVVNHSSWRHRLLMMHAEVLANAYSIKHMIPRQWSPRTYTQHLAWRVGAVRIYLKHGVNVSANSVKRGTGGYDMYLSVNPRETGALRESSGYGDQIVEAGMPRFDALEPGPATRTVLFMPTWRRYLVPKLFGDTGRALMAFEGSTYEQFLRGFLTSPRLHDILTRYDYRLQFVPHYNLVDHLSSFDLSSDRTNVADTTVTSFQDLIRGCDAFITDHSSVHFDVAYLGTPIIYTHFDRDEYAAGHASVSWFEHERDGFGPVVYTLEEALDALEDLLARGCAQDETYAARVDAAFTYRDRSNSARVVSAIDRLLLSSKINP